MPMKQRWYEAAGLLAAGALAGGILAGTLSANAATGPSAPPSGTGTHATAPDGDGGHAGEVALTGTDLARAKAAALKAVPGGTVDRVESDSGDAAYEAHMMKADGMQVTVKFDKSLQVTAVEAGMGK